MKSEAPALRHMICAAFPFSAATVLAPAPRVKRRRRRAKKAARKRTET